MSWYLDNNNQLNHADLAPEIAGDNFVSPYPATFWRVSDNKLTLNSDNWSPIPDEIAGEILTPPYPASFWYLDNNNKLNMALIPPELIITDGIVHDNVDGTEYFNVSNNNYNVALQSAHNAYRIRLEILSDDESVIGEITKDLSLTAAGQITINYEQITRRSCSLSLINVENKYIPTKNSPFWLNRKFKLWLGLVVGKDTYWWSEGVFYTVSANANGRVLNIEAVDKGGALDGTLKLNMTEAQYQFGRNVPITEIIKQSLSLDVGNPYGATSSPIGYGGNRPVDCKPPLVGIEYYNFKTVSEISIDANAYISELFVQMGELYAADCYYNTDGYLMFVPHIDSTGYKYAPTQWEFTDLSSTFEDVNYEYNYEGENVVTVYTNTSEAGVRNVAWTAYNTNPLSPINVSTGIRRAEHIEIPYYILDNKEEIAQAKADLKTIQDEMTELNVDPTVTVYGNIDTNARQILKWNAYNLERFEDEIESWDLDSTELAGSISTVIGTSEEFDDVEIAFSPILQTENGAVLLHADVVRGYIGQLITDLGSGWTKEGLLAADVIGLTIDGVLVKKLIADAGSTAIHTGESMHYVGKYGALALAEQDVYDAEHLNEIQQIKDCRSAANHYLLSASMVGMTLTFNTPIIPHIDVNKTIQITDQYADIEDGIYVVQSVTIPLSGDKMQITATNINWLPNDMTFSGVSEIVETNNNNEGGAGNG